MTGENKWRVKESAKGRESGWEADELVHLRYFRSLSMTEKIRAVEEMCRLAQALSKDAAKRRAPPP